MLAGAFCNHNGTIQPDFTPLPQDKRTDFVLDLFSQV
jgi:hypothetical protein